MCTDTDTETVVIANKWCEFVHKIYRGTPRDVCQAVYDDLVSNPVQSKVTDYTTHTIRVEVTVDRSPITRATIGGFERSEGPGP